MQSHSNHIHSEWAFDCSLDYDIQWWGRGFISDKRLTLRNLKNKIDSFKPDYIYMTGRKKYICTKKKDKIHKCWLPDLTNIKVPKIFVEVDTYRYNSNDPWYTQFDSVYCRNNTWNDWENTPVLIWSVSEKAFPVIAGIRRDIFFIGTIDKKPYFYRREIRCRFHNRIKFCTVIGDQYWTILQSAAALLCPAEGRIGKEVALYTPAKLFEFLASGAAVITNCDLNSAGIPELEPYVIRYNGLDDLESKLSMDFVPYHDKALEEMRNHTHRVRYKELFG